MEERTLRCPNCGANATNHNNCEYCGSLLVRFVEKGIDLSNTSYTSNTKVFSGLIKELEQNLALQKKVDEPTATDIFRELDKRGNAVGGVISVLRTGNSAWQDGQEYILSNSNKGLVICVDFNTYINTDDNGSVNYNKEQERQHILFKQLPCYELFTPHRCFQKDPNGLEVKTVEYAIDFGEDAEGAARLISEIMIKVYGVLLNEDVEFYTNYGDNIEKTRKQIYASRGFNISEEKEDSSDLSQIPWWGWAIGAFILFKLIQWLF